ncbi:FAD-binding protein [Candidatus Latescibacterota bacterium]
MKRETITIYGVHIDVYSLNTVVVGTGAAGLNAADRLYAFGQEDIAIVTEGMNSGTSRNTGSDKQTYYKVTMAGDTGDSVGEMAETLYKGGAMHGDIALVETALSARCFFRLVDIGVPFPHNRYGEFIGYKTDHDPRQRATSVGPLTSRLMTEKLQEQVESKGITVFDGYQVIGILTDGTGENSTGLIALNKAEIGNPDRRYALFNCTNIVYAVGGPAGMYGTSVYPKSQTGASGIAFEAGVAGQNLTESQFGIASVGFRWNLSGTYQQVLPRYISTDGVGNDEREFLDEYISSPGDMLDSVFLKGYQWPFDPRKLDSEQSRSSLVDVLVYHETVVKGRRVFLDYTQNPSSAISDGNMNFDLLGPEAYSYLEKSGALFGTPLDRLLHMNRPAYVLYREHGIDLRNDRLEIAVCAQHNNGGLAGNIWWESSVRHFFPVGEVNGSHGVYRPGGSSLNAGQVGSTRAAEYIARRYSDDPPGIDDFLAQCSSRIEEKVTMGESFVKACGGISTVTETRTSLGERMNRLGGIIRSLDDITSGIAETKADLDSLVGQTRLDVLEELPDAFRNYDLLLAQYVYLSAIACYIEGGGKSRGSYLVHDPDGEIPETASSLPSLFRYSCEEPGEQNRILTVLLKNGTCRFTWDSARPVPHEDQWFETVWNDYRNDKIVR